jgi:hypothetical protein
MTNTEQAPPGEDQEVLDVLASLDARTPNPEDPVVRHRDRTKTPQHVYESKREGVSEFSPRTARGVHPTACRAPSI